MKKLILSVALISWIGYSASAQEQKKEHKKEVHHVQKEHNMQHWCWKDGKIVEMKDGKSMHMTKETKVGDVWIHPNGEVVMKDKKVVKLQADQYLDHNGTIHQMMKPQEIKKMPSKK